MRAFNKSLLFQSKAGSFDCFSDRVVSSAHAVPIELATKVSNSLMAKIHKMFHRISHSREVIGADIFDAGKIAVVPCIDHRDIDRRTNEVLFHPKGKDSDSLHLPLLHSNRTGCNMVRVGLGVREADQHLIALFYCRSLEIEDDFRKEWIAAAKFRDH